jgi:small redox-active disulfide protein 2
MQNDLMALYHNDYFEKEKRTMSLFGAGKKKEDAKTSACACNGNAAETDTEETSGRCCCGATAGEVTSIKVLGSGCKFCRELLENAQCAVKDMNLDVEVEYITDMEKVMTYGVMSMPALVVNEKIAAMGKVLKQREIEDILQKMSV